MGEQTKKTDLELAIARNSRVLEGVQEDVAGLHPKAIDTANFTTFAEDFLDPQHPLYGTMDEHGRPIPSWLAQITIRSIVLSAAIGFVFNLMVLKLGFTVGVIPSLNIAAGLIGFCGIKGFVALARAVGLHSLAKPFTRQENTVIQTTVVACYGLAFSGGFTNSLIAMDWNSYLQAEGGEIVYPDSDVPISAYSNPPPNLPSDVVEPSIAKYIGFMALIYFIGVFVMVPLRRLFILKYRLTYPSGTATGTIINSFHTPLGELAAKVQIKKLGKWTGISMIYSAIKWVFSGKGEECGMGNIPSLGFEAKTWQWYCDFSQTFIGIGLLVPKHITYGILVGAVLSYGIMWPLINNKGGDWFPVQYKQPSTNVKGIYAYKVFVGLGFILGDGLYNICKLAIITSLDMFNRSRQASTILPGEEVVPLEEMTPEERHEVKLRNLRDHIFLNGQIPTKIALATYVAIAAVCMGVTPQLFPGVKAYYVLIAYLVAPALGFCNSYGAGLSDWSLLTTYGKLCILIFAAWGGSNGGIIAGLAVCTIMQCVVGMSSDLMQDFKTGYLTLSSPRSMFAAQLIGALLAVIISPAAFWLYWSGFKVGSPYSEYKAPFAPVFRNFALVAVKGSSVLPKNCLSIAGGTFVLAILLDALRDYMARRLSPESTWVKLIPIPSMIGIPSFIGGYFAIDMAIGAVILGIWQHANPADALLTAPLVASGLIAGDGIWSVPAAVLSLAKVEPPMCAQFFKTEYFHDKVAGLLDEQ